MRVLAVTGLLAEDIVKRSASETGKEIDVVSLPVTVAAFITPEYAANLLKRLDLRNYDMILMPGSVQGDVSSVEEATGIPTFKGTIHAADLAICFMEGLSLSKITPASELARDVIRMKAEAEIEEALANWRVAYARRGGLVIGSSDGAVPVGQGFPMPVIAEIVNTPQRKLDEIARLAKYYEAEGAQIIDMGMIAGKPAPDKIAKIIDVLRASVDIPISVDTLDASEIKSAVKSEIDLVLSVDAGNILEVYEEVLETPTVVLPSNMRRGILAEDPARRVADLIENIGKARHLGLRKIIADPVLEPAFQPGLMSSLTTYRLFREKEGQTPVLFGLGNVTELIDVDSVGVNGLLTALAYELGANLLFTPEFSVKTRGSVRELSTASKMMFLAKRRFVLPKDLGIDLLALKEKRWIEEPPIKDDEAKAYKASKDIRFTPDKLGWFKIQLDREAGKIEAIFYRHGDNKPTAVVVGDEATEVYQTIVREKMIRKLEHASYLGRELEKAEIALRLGRSYVQDEDLF
ncbi:dihydropteroate synthase-like protein [Candidatus Bathyarchaeota archaeon]|nr:dihydropteroate synthase-like protein [Candidatus Bathyarchaeota archaeon]